MHTNYKGTNYDDSFVENIYKPMSYAKRKAKNFKWCENMADHLDHYHYGTDCSTRNKKYAMNYDLYNGRADMSDYNSLDYYSPDMEDSMAYLNSDNINHHDIISSVAKSYVGEQIKMKFKPMAFDTSMNSFNQRRRKKLGLLQDYIGQSILGPLQEEVMAQVMQEMGIQDPSQLNEEQGQQFEQSMQQGMQARTPKEIDSYMRKDYKSPEDIQANQLLQYFVREQNMKFKFDENFKHGIIVGEPVFYVGIRNGDPKLDLVNPKGFTYEASDNTLFIEDAEHCRYEQYTRVTDLITKYGDELTPSDIDKLRTMSYSGSGDYDEHSPRIESKLVRTIENTPEDQLPNLKTRDGQRARNELIGSISSGEGDSRAVREVHFCYKVPRKMKLVTRLDPETGTKEKFWVDEAYEANPATDIKVENKVVPQVWETVKIGNTQDAIYVRKRPIPYQYKSIENPFEVKLPYLGISFGRLMNNTKNVSVIDLGKPYQYWYNVQRKRIDEMQETNIGKVLLATMNAIPKEWDWDKWFRTIRKGKVAIVDLMQEGVSPIDAQVFKSVDLSNMQDIVANIELLKYIEDKIVMAMGYNPARIGSPNPYESVTNNQQNIIQSATITEGIFSAYNKVIENVLNYFVNTARIAWKGKSLRKNMVLDDMSIAEIEIDGDMLHRSEIGIFISNSVEDMQNLDQVKQLIQPMIQNGQITFREVIKLMWSKSPAEIMNVVEEAEEKMQEMQQQQQQQQEQMMQQQAEQQQQLVQLEHQMGLERDEFNNQFDLMKAEIDASKFKQQMDVNENNQSDLIEKELIIADHETKEKQKDREFEQREKQKDRELEKYKVNKQAKAKNNQSKK